MAILESVRELASKLGANTNGRTIADQINIINRHLEADTANDIAGAVKEYSKKAGSGGTLSFERINTVIPDFSPTTGYYGIAYAQIVNNSSDEVTLSYEDGNEIFIVINPVKRLNMIPNSVGGAQKVIFAAADDFVGIYNTSTGSKINFSEAPVGNGKATTVTMDYRNNDYFLTNNYGNFDMFFNIVE